jgi:hypothetical protein
MNAFEFQRKDAETQRRKGFFSSRDNPSSSRVSGKIFYHGWHGWKTYLFLSVPSVVDFFLGVFALNHKNVSHTNN